MLPWLEGKNVVNINSLPPINYEKSDIPENLFILTTEKERLINDL